MVQLFKKIKLYAKLGPETIWKTVNELKNYVPAVSMFMSFKVLKEFRSGKISFFLFASLWWRNLKPEKSMIFFSEILIL